MSNPHTYLEPWRPADYIMSGEHDPADFDHSAGAYYRPHRLFGRGHPALFAHGRPVAAPWAPAMANPMRDARELVGAAVRSVIDRTVRLEPVDPRWLRMSQSGVTADGVRYYMEQPRYRHCGITYADQDMAGNRVPMILQRPDVGHRIILAGHHRSTAALLAGRPVRAVVVRFTPQERKATDGAVFVTEMLYVGRGPDDTRPFDGSVTCGSAPQAAAVIAAGSIAVVPSADVARQTLVLLGSTPAWAEYIAGTSARSIG